MFKFRMGQTSGDISLASGQLVTPASTMSGVSPPRQSVLAQQGQEVIWIPMRSRLRLPGHLKRMSALLGYHSVSKVGVQPLVSQAEELCSRLSSENMTPTWFSSFN